MEEKMLKIKHNLKVAQDRNKIYANKGRNHKEFKVGDHVYLKVKAKKSSQKLENYSKLAARYC
jgi:exosome complex RNA-binding protein Rrp4